MVIDSKLVKPNIPKPIEVRPEPRVTDDNEEHTQKTYSPTEVTLSGMTTDVKEESVNALSPIEVTLLEMMTVFKELQPAKAPARILVLPGRGMAIISLAPPQSSHDEQDTTDPEGAADGPSDGATDGATDGRIGAKVVGAAEGTLQPVSGHP